MRGCTGLAAVTACLAATSAYAQAEDGGEYRIKALGTEALTARRPFDAQRILPDPQAPAAPDTRLLRSLPVADNFDFGVGIFSVVGETEKETMRRRTDPTQEVHGQRSKVAAVGLSLRF
jgi:hypothetical protein